MRGSPARSRRPEHGGARRQAGAARGGSLSEPEGRSAAWTEERGTSDEGRRRLKARPASERGNAVSGAARKHQATARTPAEPRGRARLATGPDGSLKGENMTETTASGSAQGGAGARKGLTIRRIHTRE